MDANSNQPHSFECLCIQGFEELKPRHNDAIYDRRSKPNAKTERKLTNLSVIPQNRDKRQDSPSRVLKGPDEESEYLKMNQMGATSYERSKMNVSSEVKHGISPNLPGMRDRAMYAQPYPIERSCSRVRWAEAASWWLSKRGTQRETDGSVSNTSRPIKNMKPPGKALKGTDKESGTHLMGEMNYDI
jgi:hypothetical protein